MLEVEFFAVWYLPLCSHLLLQVGDTRYCYMVVFPVKFWLKGPRAAGHTLTVSAFAEWLNIALKWDNYNDTSSCHIEVCLSLALLFSLSLNSHALSVTLFILLFHEIMLLMIG